MLPNLGAEEQRVLEAISQGRNRLDRLSEEELLTGVQLMEGLRVKCVEEGLFEDAENSKLMVRDLKQALSIARLNHVRTQHEIQRQKLSEDFDEEMRQLSAFWEEKIQMYVDECVKLEQQQEEASHSALETYHSQLEEGLPARARNSSHVIELQDRLEKLVRQQEYREAQAINKKLEELLRAEQAKFDAQRAKKMQKMLEQAAQQRQLEKNALKKRITAGLDELIAQRDKEHQKLIQKFNNIGRSLSSQQTLQSKQMERSTQITTSCASLSKASSFTQKRID